MKRLLCLAAFCALLPGQNEGWWMREPLRWAQTNLREVDSGSDPLKLVEEAARFRANVLHVNLGGIVATYPTGIRFHHRSRYLQPGKDFFGEVLRAAHAKGIRVVGRFDFSKIHQDAFEAHPEWLFRKADGSPVIYHGLYSTCINSTWYREEAPRILAEALERYDVDGLFFNMFGNQSRDYSGNFVGHCHCQECQRLFRAAYGADLPKDLNDPRYREFMFSSSREVASAFGKLIHEKRPKAGYFNYIDEWTDGIMSESNTALDRPLPLWPYTSSDNVNRARNSQPLKMPVNLCMQFVDYAWRHATVPAAEIVTRLWQNVAYGGAMALAINGTWDQQDSLAVEAARPVFAWAAENERYYVGQKPAARVILLNRGARENYRGLFRLLSELHVPFSVASNLDWVGRRTVDLVVAPEADISGLEQYLAKGGKLLTVAASPGSETVRGYLRVRQPERFPGLPLTKLLMLNGPFTRLPEDPKAPLTLVPDSIFGPPEYIHADLKDTAVPALVSAENGRVVRLPFNLGAMYHRFSLPSHAAMFKDVLWPMLPVKQIETNAHPLVEMSLMRQPDRVLLHLINLSGHSQTAWFPPLPMDAIDVSVEGSYNSARAVRLGRTLPVSSSNGRTAFQLPRLADYELIELAVQK